MPNNIKTEQEIKAKRDEAYRRYDAASLKGDNNAEIAYNETVAQVLDWILGEADDPFKDSGAE